MVGITKMKAEKQKAEKGAFFCTTKELSRLGLEPVSYTHLDVYKRQVLQSPHRPQREDVLHRRNPVQSE